MLIGILANKLVYSLLDNKLRRESEGRKGKNSSKGHRGYCESV